MKKNLKIISIFILLMMMFGITDKVNALTITKGNATKDENKLYIPLNVTIEEEDNIESLTMECGNDGTDVMCTIEENKEYGAYKNGGRDYVPIGASSFEAGTYSKMFTMVLENSSTTDKEIDVYLENSFYNGNKDNEITFRVNKANVPSTKKTLSNNPNAKIIKFSKGTLVPEFNPNVTSYTLYNIQDTINSVTLSYECAEGECSDEGVTGGKSTSGNKIYLDAGENKASITIRSEDGDKSKTYNFIIIRGETVFNSAKLKELSIGDYILTPAFSKDVVDYSINVPNKITSIKTLIKAIAEDDKANVTMEGLTDLKVGENKVKIIIDNSDASETKTYTINVNRMDNGSIEIVAYKNGKVTFMDSEEVKNTMDEEQFKSQYPDEYNKIVNGTYKFDKDGNRETEKTTEKVEEVKEEKKDEKKSNNKIIIIIILIVAGLVIIIVSGLLIFKKKPKDKVKDNVADSNNVESLENESNEEVVYDPIEEDIPREVASASDETADIEEALEDLMSTKQYNLEDFTKNDEE